MVDGRILSDVTLVLIATASILIDRSLQSSGGKRDRLCCQVWLWLAASVSHRGGQTSSLVLSSSPMLVDCWVHAIMFGNIVGIVAERAIPSKNKARQSQSQNEGLNTTTTSKNGMFESQARGPNRIEDICRLLAPSAWISLMTIVVNVNGSIAKPPSTEQEHFILQQQLSLFMFAISFSVLCGIQWHQTRRRLRDADMQGMPVATTYRYDKSSGCCRGVTSGAFPAETLPLQQEQYSCTRSSEFLDEQIWYAWSPEQVLKWISRIIEEQEYNDDSTLQQEIILSTLSPHHISGRILDHLSLSELRSLDIPYGPACEISMEINRLVHNFPKPGCLQDTSTASSTICRPVDWTQKGSSAPSADWLTLHDQEYNSIERDLNGHLRDIRYTGEEILTAMISRKDDVSSLASPLATSHLVDGTLDEQAQQRIQETMKERFGLELPKLKRPSLETALVENDRNTDGIQKLFWQTNASKEPLTSSIDLIESEPTPIANGASSAPNPTWRDPTARHQQIDTPGLDGILPVEVWRDMPSHIQEIAQRNPEIVQHLITQKQQQLLQHQSKDRNDTAADPSAVSTKVPDQDSDCFKQSFPPIIPTTVLDEDDDPSASFLDDQPLLGNDHYDEPSATNLWNYHTQDEYSIPNPSNADDERTNLLQHRKKSNQSSFASGSSNYWAINPA